MITKKTYPIIGQAVDITHRTVTGTITEYRIFGLLLYRKQLIMPNNYIGGEHFYTYRF